MGTDEPTSGISETWRQFLLNHPSAEEQRQQMLDLGDRLARGIKEGIRSAHNAFWQSLQQHIDDGRRTPPDGLSVEDEIIARVTVNDKVFAKAYKTPTSEEEVDRICLGMKRCLMNELDIPIASD